MTDVENFNELKTSISNIITRSKTGGPSIREGAPFRINTVLFKRVHPGLFVAALTNNDNLVFYY